jgi:hypothetical protein
MRMSAIWEVLIGSNDGEGREAREEGDSEGIDRTE